jgi:hypothetical protein
LSIELEILACILEEDIDIADQGGVLDIVIGKLAPGQQASDPTDVQLKDSEYKFCKKKKLNDVALKERWTRRFYVPYRPRLPANSLLVFCRAVGRGR